MSENKWQKGEKIFSHCKFKIKDQFKKRKIFRAMNYLWGKARVKSEQMCSPPMKFNTRKNSFKKEKSHSDWTEYFISRNE